jgi:putative flippase GtrA
MGAPRAFGRWVRFNGVGAMGMAVQLGTLAALTYGAGIHYLIATAIAVEAAVLHNFLWHQRWTWRDRPSGAVETARRLARFHALNGAISIAGNLAVMAVLAGGVGVSPIAANALAIAVCSVVNFFASEVLVFRTAAAVVLMLVIAPDAPRTVAAADLVATLQPHTVAAWRAYEQQVDARYQKLAAGGTFFVHDELGKGSAWRQTARSGSVAMMELNAPGPGAKEPEVPDGRIHHWVGAVFVPGATVESVVARLQERAGREAGAYQDVLDSRLLERSGDRLRVFMKLRRDSVITVMYNTEHAVEYRRLGAARASSRSVATKIAELSDPGTPREREKPPSEDRGFLWRLNAYWRYEQTDGGVLIECESVSLSRSVPYLIRPFVNGMVEGIARESLERTLISLKRVLT